MSVFENLKVMKDNSPYGKLYMSKEVFNSFINDNRTVKKRIKDTMKLLKNLKKRITETELIDKLFIGDKNGI